MPTTKRKITDREIDSLFLATHDPLQIVWLGSATRCSPFLIFLPTDKPRLAALLQAVGTVTWACGPDWFYFALNLHLHVTGWIDFIDPWNFNPNK